MVNDAHMVIAKNGMPIAATTKAHTLLSAVHHPNLPPQIKATMNGVTVMTTTQNRTVTMLTPPFPDTPQGGSCFIPCLGGNTHPMTYEQVTDSIYRFPDQDQGDPVQALWRMQNETRLQAREANKHTQDH